MGKFCSARVNPKCAQLAIDKRNIKRLFIKEEIFIVKNSKHTCVLKAIFPQEKSKNSVVVDEFVVRILNM